MTEEEFDAARAAEDYYIDGLKEDRHARMVAYFIEQGFTLVQVMDFLGKMETINEEEFDDIVELFEAVQEADALADENLDPINIDAIDALADKNLDPINIDAIDKLADDNSRGSSPDIADKLNENDTNRFANLLANYRW